MYVFICDRKINNKHKVVFRLSSGERVNICILKITDSNYTVL